MAVGATLFMPIVLSELLMLVSGFLLYEIGVLFYFHKKEDNFTIFLVQSSFWINQSINLLKAKGLIFWMSG